MLSAEIVDELNQPFGLSQTTPARQMRYRWLCPVLTQEMGDVSVVPLTSFKALSCEGWHIQLCVARYETKCAKGLNQVFSIRDIRGNRPATLGLTCDACGWKVDQCLGFKNAEVLMKTTE